MGELPLKDDVENYSSDTEGDDEKEEETVSSTGTCSSCYFDFSAAPGMPKEDQDAIVGERHYSMSCLSQRQQKRQEGKLQASLESRVPPPG